MVHAGGLLLACFRVCDTAAAAVKELKPSEKVRALAPGAKVIAIKGAAAARKITLRLLTRRSTIPLGLGLAKRRLKEFRVPLIADRSHPTGCGRSNCSPVLNVGKQVRLVAKQF